MEFDSDEDFFEAAGDPKTEALRKFIELYESLPVLWNCKHDSYKNKAAKNAALDKLVRVYQSVKTGATRADVTKKINSLRTNFRKELKRVVSSKRSGAGADEIYQPSSWLFEALQFLRNTEQPASHITESGKVADVVLRTSKVSNSSPPASHSRSSIITASTPRKKQRIVGPVQKQNELLTIACKYLQQDASPSTEMPAIAKAWGEKLISLESRQRIFAEKAINDVLYEATLGNLTSNCVQINVGDHLDRSLNNPRRCTSRASTPNVVETRNPKRKTDNNNDMPGTNATISEELYNSEPVHNERNSASDLRWSDDECYDPLLPVYYEYETSSSEVVTETSAGVKHRTDTVSSIEVNNTSPYEDGITSYSESSVASTFGSVTVNKLSHRKSGTSESPSELSADSKCMSVISNRKPPRETESSPLLRLSGSKFQSITVAGKQLYDAGFTPHRESSARSYNSSPYEGSSFGSRFDSISSNRESHHAAGFTPCSESSSDVNNNSLCGSYPGPTAGSKFGSTIWNREPHRQAGVTSPQNSSAGVNNTPPYETRNTPYPESPSASKFGPVTMNKMSHHEPGVSSYPESSVGSKRISIISNSIPPEVIESSQPTRSSAGSQIRSITMTGKLPCQVGFTTHAESSVRPYNASHSEEPSTGSKNDSIIANREPYRAAGFTPRSESSGDVNNNPPCRNEIISYPGSTAGSKFGSTLWNREPHRQAGVTSPQNSSAGVNNTPPYETRNTPYPESPYASKFGPVTMNRMSHHESDASSYPESSAGSKRVSIITNSIPSEEIESSPPTRSLAGSQIRSITMTGKPPRQVGLTTHAESSVRPYNTSHSEEPSTDSKTDSISSNREPHHAAGLTPQPESLRGVNNTPPCGNGIISHPGPSADSKFESINVNRISYRDPREGEMIPYPGSSAGFEFGSLPFNRKPPNDLFSPDPQSSAGASNASLYERQFASLPRSSAGSEFDLIAANMAQSSEAGFLPNSGSSASAIHISPREDTFSLNLGSSAGTMSSNRTDCVKLGTIVKNSLSTPVSTTPYEVVSTTAPVSTTHEFGLPLSQRSSKGAKVQTKSDGPIATINPAKLSLRNVRFRKLPKTSTSVAYVSTSTNSISNPISSEDEIGKQSITSSDAKPGLTSAVKSSKIMYPLNCNSKFAHPESSPDAISEVTPKHHTSNPASPGATLTQHAVTFFENESHSISKQHVSNHASLGPELELSEETSVGAIQGFSENVTSSPEIAFEPPSHPINNTKSKSTTPQSFIFNPKLSKAALLYEKSDGGSRPEIKLEFSHRHRAQTIQEQIVSNTFSNIELPSAGISSQTINHGANSAEVILDGHTIYETYSEDD